MEDLVTLVRLRGRLKSRLTSFHSFLERAKVDNDKSAEVSMRLERLEEVWKDFIAVQDKIDELVEDNQINNDEQATERNCFEDSYYSAKVKGKLLLPSETENVNLPASVPVAQVVNMPQLPVQKSVNLPSINLPKFHGSYDQWISFRDIFTSLIHENVSLTAVQKLHYLKASLAGEASHVLSSFELTHDNYDIAWKLLEKRYENKRLIVQHHIQALFDVSALNKESYVALRQLVDEVSLRVQALSKLGQPVDTWDTLIIHMIIPKIDKSSRREWESQRATSREFPTLSELMDFLIQRSAFLESYTQTSTMHSAANDHSAYIENKTNKFKKQFSRAYVTSEGDNCPFCKGNHTVPYCSVFQKWPLEKRNSEVRNKKLCFICLRAYHGRQCNAPPCKRCQRGHHILLHYNNAATNVQFKGTHDNAKTSAVDKNTASEIPKNEKMLGNNEGKPSTSYNHCAMVSPAQVLLSTAIVLVRDKHGTYHSARALLDNGSQSNFMTRQLCDRLQLDKRHVNTTILSINEVPVPTTQQTRTTIKSKHNSYVNTNSFVILDRITDKLPATSVKIGSFKIPRNINLADPNYHTPGGIDILLGASIFWELLCVGQFRLSKGQPTFQKTKLGWIISGTLKNSSSA